MSRSHRRRRNRWHDDDAQTAPPPPVAGRVPPHDLDAEAAVLSAILVADERGTLNAVRPILSGEHFYSEANRAIFDAACSLASQGRAIDLVTVADAMRERDTLRSVGGPAYLAQLSDATPSYLNIVDHARIVRDKADQRRMIARLDVAHANGYDARDTRAYLRETAENITAALRQSERGARLTVGPRVRSFADIAQEAQATIMRRASGEERPIETPWPALNAALRGGFWPAYYSIVSASGMGKTQWALHCAVWAAILELAAAIREGREPRRVRYIALELGSVELFARSIGLLVGAMWSDILYGQCGPRVATAIINALQPTGGPDASEFPMLAKLSRLPLDVQEASPLDYSYRDVEALADDRPLLAVLDYVQLVGAPDDLQEEARRTMARTALAARGVARTAGVPIVGISSTSRAHYSSVDGTKAKEKKGEDPPEPMGTGDARRLLALAKESGDVEFASDVVMVLGRNHGEGEKAWLGIAKARAGSPGGQWVPLRWTGGAFEDWPDEDPPAESGSTGTTNEPRPALWRTEGGARRAGKGAR